MGKVGLVGSLLLLLTTFATLLLMALEICEYGTAELLNIAISKVTYLNLLALLFLWMGYKERDNLTIAIVAASILGMSWIVVDGFLIMEQVNFKGLAPCFGQYLEDGDYGKIVYFYGPYFFSLYLVLTTILFYQYIIKINIVYKRKFFDS